MYLDRKVVLWQRDYLNIEAASKKDAQKEMEKFIKSGLVNDSRIFDTDFSDIESVVEVGVDNEPTVLLYDSDGNELITNSEM
jgi:hypothetical protein